MVPSPSLPLGSGAQQLAQLSPSSSWRLPLRCSCWRPLCEQRAPNTWITAPLASTVRSRRETLLVADTHVGRCSARTAAGSSGAFPLCALDAGRTTAGNSKRPWGRPIQQVNPATCCEKRTMMISLSLFLARGAISKNLLAATLYFIHLKQRNTADKEEREGREAEGDRSHHGGKASKALSNKRSCSSSGLHPPLGFDAPRPEPLQSSPRLEAVSTAALCSTHP